MATEKTQVTAAPGAAWYRQKGGEVEAWQLLDDLRNHTAIAAWVEAGGGHALIPFAEPCLYIETENGQEQADIGDWIVRFPAGTFRVISAEDFTAAFEPAGDPDSAAQLSVAREQASRYLRAVYGPDLVYRAPETLPGPELWMWALAYDQGTMAETVIARIELACAARREEGGRG